MVSEHKSSRSAAGRRRAMWWRNRVRRSLFFFVMRRTTRRTQLAISQLAIAEGGQALATNGEVRPNACLPPLALGLSKE